MSDAPELPPLPDRKDWDTGTLLAWREAHEAPLRAEIKKLNERLIKQDQDWKHWYPRNMLALKERAEAAERERAEAIRLMEQANIGAGIADAMRNRLEKERDELIGKLEAIRTGKP